MSRRMFLMIGFFVMIFSGCPSTESPTPNVANGQVRDRVVTPAVAGSKPFQQTGKIYSGTAVGNRKLWPATVNTPEGFDRASRAAILFYALELGRQQTAESKGGSRQSVLKWLEKEADLAKQNYDAAAKSCGSGDWTCIGVVDGSDDFIAKAATMRIPADFDGWQKNIAEFVGIYVAEQIRLAALFPKTSSEIDLFNDHEWSGDETTDRRFYLTFDDGPTAPGGNTDKVLEMLAAEKKTAVFFVLGKNFSARQKANGAAAMARSYQSQCVAAHGWEHLSHEKRSKYALGDSWRKSISDTMDLLRGTFDESTAAPLFRPPYGQRKPDSGEFFEQQSLKVALWNIDSQDWNSVMEPEDVINRTETLMLIKRRGVLLFHDIHPKAYRAVPTIAADFGNAVEWGDCRRIPQ